MKLLSSALSIRIALSLSLTTLWFTSFYFLSNTPDLGFITYFALALLTTLAQTWALEQLGYGHSFHPIPPLDSFFSVLVTTPAAGLLTTTLAEFFLEVHLLDLKTLFFESLLITLIYSFIHRALGIALYRSGIKKELVLYTTPEEEKRVYRALRSQLLHRFYKFTTDPTSNEVTYVISRAALNHFKHNEEVIESMVRGSLILDYRELTARLRGHLDIDNLDLWMFLIQASRRSTLARLYYSTKTLLERLLSGLGLIALSPLFFIVAIAIKINSPGPIFYIQKRLGLKGKDIWVIKFRSMHIDAEARGHQWATKNDPRVTAVGRILRSTRIDELPQLWNVFHGEMSLIGPRPERPEFYDELEKVIPLFRLRLLLRPGITGWAQVKGGYAVSANRTKRKLEYDLFYLQRMTPSLDFLIAMKTMAVALRALFSFTSK